MPENTQVKSKRRVADHGEVFTNPREVNAMLDLVKDESVRIDSRFLEPACGDGNFLIEILHRKLVTITSRYARGTAEFHKYLHRQISIRFRPGLQPSVDERNTVRVTQLVRERDKLYRVNNQADVITNKISYGRF